MLRLKKKYLETPRLIIRAITASEVKEFSYKDFSLDIATPLRLDSALIIYLKERNNPIGLIKCDVIEDNLNIAFGLLAEYRGYGFMTEAIRELERHVFLSLSIKKIVASAPNFTNESLRVLTKRGFIIENNIAYKERDSYLSRLDHVKLYDIKGSPTNKWIYRGDRVPRGMKRGVVDIIIYNEKYDRYLATRRDRNKDVHPGRMETTGGAITIGEEEAVAARREVMEETGITDLRLEYLYTYNIDNVIYFEYLGITSCELDSVVLQEGETCDYIWMEKGSYLRMWKTDWVAPRQKIRLLKALEELK